MKYVVSVVYTECGKDENCVRERARKRLRRKAHISVRKDDEAVTTPLAIFQKWKKMGEAKKEVFMALALNTQNEVIKTEVISVGTLNASLVHPREVFKFAIDNLAASIIVVHNHPSGSLEPSQEDITTTKRLAEAGKYIGISVLDHVIITKSGYRSLRESGAYLGFTQ